MTIAGRVPLLLAAVVAGLGLVATGLTLGLPWQEPEFRLGPASRVLMACTGAAILLLAAGHRRAPSVRLVTALLGLTVLIYPTSLSATAAGLGGPLVQVAGQGGHVLPLTLVQVLPVLASEVATGRSRRRWLIVIVGVALVSTAATVLTLSGAGGAEIGLVGTVAWFGSFVLAPVATWTNVAGLSGEPRRRGVVAALAAVIPVVIIAWCLVLGSAAESQGLSEDAAVTALMIGFCLATAGTAVLVAAATGPDHHAWLLRRRVVTGLLTGLLVAATVLVAAGGSLLALAAGAGGAPASLIGIALVVVLGSVAVWMVGWAARAVDPDAELVEQLALLGPVPDGTHGQALQQVLRQTTGASGLVLLVRAPDGSWLDPYGTSHQAPAADAFALSGPVDRPTAVVVGADPGAVRQLARLGDCEAVLRPAVLEVAVLQERRRADDAARAERLRLSQDLHDGLQGQLLGLALNLQLSGREVEDPAARLLVEQTVASLRDAVEDVRSLAGGRLPAILVHGGLRPALSDLVRPLTTVVDLAVPDRRFAAEVEAVGYFVVGEAISNAIKHSGATRVSVQVEQVGAALVIMVSDDGVGGADPRLGSGLRGLAERVAASGGALVVRDAVPTGTVVEASLPCGS